MTHESFSAQSEHAAPPLPHATTLVPVTHSLLMQHPVGHVVGLHVVTAISQRPARRVAGKRARACLAVFPPVPHAELAFLPRRRRSRCSSPRIERPAAGSWQEPAWQVRPKVQAWQKLPKDPQSTFVVPTWQTLFSSQHPFVQLSKQGIGAQLLSPKPSFLTDVAGRARRASLTAASAGHRRVSRRALVALAASGAVGGTAVGDRHLADALVGAGEAWRAGLGNSTVTAVARDVARLAGAGVVAAPGAGGRAARDRRAECPGRREYAAVGEDGAWPWSRKPAALAGRASGTDLARGPARAASRAGRPYLAEAARVAASIGAGRRPADLRNARTTRAEIRCRANVACPPPVPQPAALVPVVHWLPLQHPLGQLAACRWRPSVRTSRPLC